METCLPGSCVPEDRISYLPDDVLLDILSFLTLSEAVKTSLLSRGWLNLWMHTSVLNFLAPDGMDSLNYVELVNHALERHKGRCLKEFKIVCHLDASKLKVIDNWLVFALSRKVEHLELNLGQGRTCCNQYFFTGRATKFDLKCLRSLSLVNVCVTGNDVNSFLMDCPLLERLEILGSMRFGNLVIRGGPSLALKYLQIKHCDNFKGLRISNANLVSLDIQPVRDLTLTDLPKLVDLSILGETIPVGDFILTDLPKLVELSILGKTAPSTIHSLSQVGSCCSQIETLILRGLTLEKAIGLSNLDRMTKLKRLVIEVFAARDESLVKLISIINSCPCLEEFVLTLYCRDREPATRTMCEVESGGQNRSLKVFELLGYYGRFSDHEMIIHVVKNAVCLEKIILDPRRLLVRRKDTRYFDAEEEQEIRSFALNQVEAMRKVKLIPPYVDVLIR